MRQIIPDLRLAFVGLLAAMVVSFVVVQPGWAATVSWTSWQSFAPGSPTGGSGSGAILPLSVNVGYSGEVLPNSYTGFGPPPMGLYPTWTPITTFQGGTVGTAPTNIGSVAISGGPATGVNTLTFSPAVVNPVMAIWSLGSANANTLGEFVFTPLEPFTIEAGGPSAETGGAAITSIGNTVFGLEGNGVIQFSGTYSSLSWTNPVFENDYAFTIGAEGVVPEPASVSLLAIAGSALLTRRRRRV